MIEISFYFFNSRKKIKYFTWLSRRKIAYFFTLFLKKRSKTKHTSKTIPIGMNMPQKGYFLRSFKYFFNRDLPALETSRSLRGVEMTTTVQHSWVHRISRRGNLGADFFSHIKFYDNKIVTFSIPSWFSFTILSQILSGMSPL